MVAFQKRLMKALIETGEALLTRKGMSVLEWPIPKVTRAAKQGPSDVIQQYAQTAKADFHERMRNPVTQKDRADAAAYHAKQVANGKATGASVEAKLLASGGEEAVHDYYSDLGKKARATVKAKLLASGGEEAVHDYYSDLGKKRVATVKAKLLASGGEEAVHDYYSDMRKKQVAKRPSSRRC
jgi:hypothetical protein